MCSFWIGEVSDGGARCGGRGDFRGGGLRQNEGRLQSADQGELGKNILASRIRRALIEDAEQTRFKVAGKARGDSLVNGQEGSSTGAGIVSGQGSEGRIQGFGGRLVHSRGIQGISASFTV